MSEHPRILSISQYGAELATGSAFSGALDRQKDYSASTRSYVVVVPGTSESSEYKEGTLRIIPTRHRDILRFLWEAYCLAVSLHREERFSALMVDNPHVMGLFGLMLRKRLRIPLVVHQMADMSWNPHYDRERFSNRLKQLLMRYVIRRTDMVRVSTNAEVERLTREGIPRERIVMVPFYINHAAYMNALAGVSVLREPHRIVYIGRLGLQKDIGTLLRAFAVVTHRVPDAHLTIVGGGSEQEKLLTLARELKVDQFVEFTGPIPREQIAVEFTRASVFAISSLYEGTCMVLQEAGSAGLPIVSTDTAGARDYIRHGSEGYLVRVRDHRAMGTYLADLLLDSELRTTMGQKSATRTTEFSRTRALEQWNELLAKTGRFTGVY